MSDTTATDGGTCLVCQQPLAPRSTAHCGDPDCRATVRAAKARVTYAAKHGVDLPLWEAIADADVGGTLPHFSVPHSGKGSADPLSTPKDAGLVFIYDNPGFSLHVGGDAGDNLRQSRVDDASLFDASVPSLMVAPSDDRSGGLPLVYNGTTTPGMLVAVSTVEINDGGVIYSRTTYDRSPDADTSALAKLPNSNDPVTLGNDAPVSSWQVNQRAHGLPADVYAFSADALIAAAGDDYGPADIFSAANIAAGLSDPFGFLVDALSESADADKVRALFYGGDLGDLDATVAYGVASAFGAYVPNHVVYFYDTFGQGIKPGESLSSAKPAEVVAANFGTIDNRVRLHNERYAAAHALLLPAPKPAKVLPPVLPPDDGPTVHAVHDRAGYLLPTSYAVAGKVAKLRPFIPKPVAPFVESSAWHKPAKYVRPADGLGCHSCNPKGVAFCDSDGLHGYVAPGSGLVHDVQYVGPWPAAGDAHVLIGRGSIPVHLVDAAAWPVAGAFRVSADYVTPQPAGYPADHYPAAPGPVVDTTLVLCASLPPGAGQQTPRPLTSWHVEFDTDRLPALLVPRHLTHDTYVHDPC